jgi:LPS-assembly lipoprotein
MIQHTIAAAVLLVALLGSGCSFRPVYQADATSSDPTGLVFDMAEPHSRLEQIIYQELALHFASSEQPTAPDLQVVASSSERDASLSATPPTRRDGAVVGSAETIEVTVTATAVVSRPGEEALTVTRFATALYNSISPNSVLATSVAQEKAQEDAAKAAAESLRLALLAQFTRTSGQL